MMQFKICLDRKEDLKLRKIILNFRNKKYITSKQIKFFLKKINEYLN